MHIYMYMYASCLAMFRDLFCGNSGIHYLTTSGNGSCGGLTCSIGDMYFPYATCVHCEIMVVYICMHARKHNYSILLCLKMHFILRQTCFLAFHLL